MNVKKKRKKIRPFTIFNTIFLSLLCAICVLPFVNLLAVSLSSRTAVELGKVGLWPVDVTLVAYEYTISGQFPRAMLISIVRTLLGSSISLIVTAMTAYPLSRPDGQLIGRKFYVYYFVFTMIFGGGLIPFYLVVSRLGLKNTIWALVIPGAMSINNMLILMNFIRGLPFSLEEAAIIDGATPMQVLRKIILPLMKPALATIALFYMVGDWNEWFHGMIFIKDSKNYPLQTYLRAVNENMEQMLLSESSSETTQLIQAMMNARTARAAQMFLGAVPIILAYPFLQKYFTKGLVIGSVKG